MEIKGRTFTNTKETPQKVRRFIGLETSQNYTRITLHVPWCAKLLANVRFRQKFLAQCPTEQ